MATEPLLQLDKTSLNFVVLPFEGSFPKTEVIITANTAVHFKVRSNCAELYSVRPNDMNLAAGESIEVVFAMKTRRYVSEANGSRMKFRVTATAAVDGRVEHYELHVARQYFPKQR